MKAADMVAMLARLTVRNFKRFEEVEIELANPVVGPKKRRSSNVSD
ncbi:MAG: hypothetical protein OXE76_13955 [Alphaproteobacteria bacterium]|nr:hypothetical protein [Alphaproteobacteria bacterium]